MYYHKTVRAGRYEFHKKYYARSYGKEVRDGTARRKTPEQIRRNNIRRQKKELEYLLDANFQDSTDALVTFSWGRDDEERPKDTDEMKRYMRNFLKRLRRTYARAGKHLKYVYKLEIGPKGSRHVHMVVNDAVLSELQQAWNGTSKKKHPVDVKPLWTDGDYSSLAAYFVKGRKDRKELPLNPTDPQSINPGKKWVTSRNLERPKVTKCKLGYKRFKTRRKDGNYCIPEKEGWYIDKDSIVEGISEVNGTPFFSWRYVREKQWNSQSRSTRGEPMERLAISGT